MSSEDVGRKESIINKVGVCVNQLLSVVLGGYKKAL